MNSRLVVLAVVAVAGSLFVVWAALCADIGDRPAFRIAADDRVQAATTDAAGAATETGHERIEERPPAPGAAGNATDARADLRDTLSELNITWPPARVHARLCALFASDPELARLAAQAMLTEVLADNKSAMLADAIVSAWLDAEAGTEAVLAACLACLESTVVDDSIRLVAPRKLGNSLRIKLAGQYLPEKLPPADAALSTRLLAALNNGANAGLPPNSAVTIIVALESATVNADASRTLAMFARNAPAAQVRCFAIQRMGMHAGPAEIVATLGGAAYTPASADEQQVGAAIFTALRTSTDRCGGDRGVLHGWIRELLSRQATTTFAEQLYISMLNAIDREDARALQPLLTDLAAHSLSEAVRSGARSTLARSR